MEDACSLVDAFRAGTISPTEALDASLAAIADSSLNAVSFVDEEQARETAAAADVSQPFGGVPIGVKELDPVQGWPRTEASLVLKDRIADYDGTMTSRLRQAGAVLVGQTTASEFGGINCTYTRLHGATSNPYDLERTPGGSSGGSAASVSGGLLPICTGGDGGGSIRIPAGFTGLFGLKATFGRIPKGPHAEIEPLTAVIGCLSRSVRDAARWYDVCNGASEYDPFSLPRVEGWEAGLGTLDLAGMKVVVSTDLGAAFVASAVKERVERAAADLIADAGLERLDIPVSLPRGGLEWALAGTASLLVDLGDRYPACESELTPEIMLAANIATNHYGLETAKDIEIFRRDMIVKTGHALRPGRLHHLRHQPRRRLPGQGTHAHGGGRGRPGQRGRLRGRGGEQRRPDHSGQHDRQPGRGHPGRTGRRAPGQHADHRPPPRRAAPAGAGPGGRTRAAVAVGGAGRAGLNGAPGGHGPVTC